MGEEELGGGKRGKTKMPNKCVLCGNDLLSIVDVSGTASYKAECRICGWYKCEDLGDEDLRRRRPDEKVMLSAYTRNLTEDVFPMPNLAEMSDEEMERIITNFEKKTLPEKLNNLILYLGNKSEYFEFPFKLVRQFDYPLTFSKNAEEFQSLWNHAKRTELIFEPQIPGHNYNTALTWKGWDKYEELKSFKAPSNICFVAMHLDSTLEDIFINGIVPAIKATNNKECRSDKEEFNDDVFDWIISNINRCKFMIADFTNQRPNVYLEAGYARGLGKPVIHTCRRDQLRDTHFDVRQNNFIGWDGPGDLKDKLINRIQATIKD